MKLSYETRVANRNRQPQSTQRFWSQHGPVGTLIRWYRSCDAENYHPYAFRAGVKISTFLVHWVYHHISNYYEQHSNLSDLLLALADHKSNKTGGGGIVCTPVVNGPSTFSCLNRAHRYRSRPGLLLAVRTRHSKSHTMVIICIFQYQFFVSSKWYAGAILISLHNILSCLLGTSSSNHG